MIRKAILQYLNINYVELEKVFPSNLHSKALGVKNYFFGTLLSTTSGNGKVIQETCLEKYFFMKSTYIALNSKIHPIKKI